MYQGREFLDACGAASRRAVSTGCPAMAAELVRSHSPDHLSFPVREIPSASPQKSHSRCR